MKIEILTIFPDFFRSPLSVSLLAQAQEKGLIDIHVRDIREHAYGRHRVTDEPPYGGGPGMVMKPEPIFGAVKAAQERLEPFEARVVLLSPQGKTFSQAMAHRLAALEGMILICGRYEGVDERVRLSLVDEEISIGDYVLNGGEAAALTVVEAVVRLLPGVLGCPESLEEETFSSGILEYPHYTRPADFNGMLVPDILLSGDHGAIRKWRRRQALLRTLKKRPDLLASTALTPEEKLWLEKMAESKDKAGGDA